MNWEAKVALCNAINNGDIESFRKVTLENIESFDTQAWDMFAQAEIKSDPESREFYKKIFPYLDKDRGDIYPELRLRDRLRLSTIEFIIDGSLTEKDIILK